MREMARAVTDHGFCMAAAIALEDLGDLGGARELRDALPEEPKAQSPDEETRERCFDVAKTSGGRAAIG
ncbi:MAG: hypothetical protein EXR95_09200 [Gemmatimonadetes bacterium]|nr:hypothetical protein [Gemmatimonadota bacterium]